MPGSTRHPFEQAIDADVVDSIAIFVMDPGSGAGVTMSWDTSMELFWVVVRLHGNDIRECLDDQGATTVNGCGRWML